MSGSVRRRRDTEADLRSRLIGGSANYLKEEA